MMKEFQHMYIYIYTYAYFTVATVNFEEEIYCVTKNDRQVQPALTLSDSSSTNVTVEVCRTAVGEIAICTYS